MKKKMKFEKVKGAKEVDTTTCDGCEQEIDEAELDENNLCPTCQLLGGDGEDEP